MSYAYGRESKVLCSSEHAIRLIGIDDPAQKVNVNRSNTRNIFQITLLERLLRNSFDVPRHILELVRSFLFATPFTFTAQVYRLIEGSRLYRPLQEEQEENSESSPSQSKGRQKQEAAKAMLRLTVHEPYQVRRGKDFFLGNQQRTVQFRVSEIWRPVRAPKHEKLLEYTSLLGNFFRLHPKYMLVCDPEEQLALKSHVDNILRNFRSYTLDITESSIMELVRRDMIWLVSSNFGYLCFDSHQNIQNLFKVRCHNGEWQFAGDKLQIWTEGVRSSAPCLVRFNNRQSYYCQGSVLARCE